MACSLAFQMRRVTQQHGRRQDGAQRVRDAFAGDVRSGAMHRLIYIDGAADGCRWQHAQRAGDDAGFIGKNVAEEILGEHDVEVARRVHQVHRAGVDVLVFERDIRILRGDLGDGSAPELGDFQNVRFIDRGNFLPALGRQLKGYAGHAHNLVAGVAHGVPCRVRLALPGTGLAEVEAAEQLAHEEDVRAVNHLRTQRRVCGERGESKGGTEVRKAAQRLAQLQQAGLGAAIRG